MAIDRRRFMRRYIPVLVMALVVLYLALLDVQSSTAEMMPGMMTFEALQLVGPQHMTAAGGVLEERLASHLQNDAGLTVSVQGNHLAISLPSDAEPSIAVAEASRIGQVELVDGGTEFLPLDKTVKTGPRAIPDQGVYQAVLTSEDFEAAEAKLRNGGRPIIEVVLTPAGDARLAAHTAELSGYYLCLAVDSRIMNCPILRTPLVNRRGIIELTGHATLDDARTLAMLIRSGPLPVTLKLTSD